MQLVSVGEASSFTRARGRWIAGVASAACLGLLGSPAAAQPAAAQAGDAGDLQAQVRALTALIQSISQRDHQQIQALTAQVQALQDRLAQNGGGAPPQPVAEAQGAVPRVLQNAKAQALVPEGQALAAASDIGIPRVMQNSTHRLTLQSSDSQYSIGLTGDVQIDAGGYLNFHPDSQAVGPQSLSDGLNARRARIGIAGTAGPWGFGLVYDAGNSSDQTAKGIETAQIVYGGLRGAAFEVGYSNTFFTLDQATSSNDTLFLERSSPSNIATSFNTGDARSNAGVRFFGDRYWLGGYFTGPASGDSHTLTEERLGAFERAAVQVIKGPDYSLHVGLGVDELLQPPNSGNGTPQIVSLSDAPDVRIDPTSLLSTGTIGTVAHPATGGHVFDLETAATYKTLFWQGEFYKYDVERFGLPNANFGGAYGEVSWSPTGDSHTYNPQSASYFRIYPKHPFSLTDHGLGAIELAARVSYVDLNSSFVRSLSLASDPTAVDGGRQVSYTLGLNWYPNDLFRFLLDYDHVEYGKAAGAAVAGAPLGSSVGARLNALTLRTQVAF